MTIFRLAHEAQDWFATAFAESGPLRTEFDKYYICLMVGLVSGRRDHLEGSAKGFVDYWITDYQGARELVLGLLLDAELKARGIQASEREAVQETCRRLFTHESGSQLTADGMTVANSIAYGGFKALQEKWPGSESPRSQLELLHFLTELMQANAFS